MYWFFDLLPFLFGLIGVVVIIVFVVFLVRRRRKEHPLGDKNWYLNLALSKEDAVSQLFILLSFFFLGVTLLELNRDFGGPLSWRTILFITSAAGVIGAYYLKTVYTLAFSLLGLISWWVAQAFHWIGNKNFKTSSVFAGLAMFALLLYSLGHLHEKKMKFKRFALVYLILGMAVVVGLLFFLSTKGGIRSLGAMTEGAPFFGSWQLTLSLLAFLVSVIGTTIYGVTQKLISPSELAAVFALTILLGMTAFLPKQTTFVQGDIYFYLGGGQLSVAGFLWALVYNLAVFLTLLGIILSGYLRRETWLINLGALFLFLLIVVKYFDWFSNSLDKSVFFIGAGFILFVVGWAMEKGRRLMLANIKTKTQSQQIPQ
jgi:hypothetical protein